MTNQKNIEERIALAGKCLEASYRAGKAADSRIVAHQVDMLFSRLGDVK